MQTDEFERWARVNGFAAGTDITWPGPNATTYTATVHTARDGDDEYEISLHNPHSKKRAQQETLNLADLYAQLRHDRIGIVTITPPTP